MEPKVRLSHRASMFLKHGDERGEERKDLFFQDDDDDRSETVGGRFLESLLSDVLSTKCINRKKYSTD